MAIFEFTEQTHIAVVYFVAWPESDFVAVVFRDGDGPWQGRHRYRYCVDGDHQRDAFAARDEKSVYDVVSRDQTREPAALIGAYDAVLQAAQGDVDPPPRVTDRIEVNGGPTEYMRLIAGKPWAHMRVVPTDNVPVQ